MTVWTRTTWWRRCAAIALAAALLVTPTVFQHRAYAADGSLTIAALSVLEKNYVDPVDPVRLLNVATAVLREGTHLGTDALPEIAPGTPRAQAAAKFTAGFSRAAQTGVAPQSILAYAATAGMLASLHDSHTYFLDPASLREGRKQIAGNPSFSGIGVGIQSHQDSTGVRWIFVEHVFAGSPAIKAGLQRFDKIVDVGGKSLRNADAVEASNLLRGPAGSSVSLTFERAGKTQNVSVVRAPIVVPPVDAKFLRPGTAYLQVYEFSRGAGLAARKALAALAAQGPIRSVVLDLRSNPGGLIVESTEIGGLFLPARTTLARVEERGSPPAVLATAGTAPYARVPLVVLVNAGSASASEIVAGALKDHQRATIVGEKTAGALGGSVIVSLPEGGMSVTVERIVLPNNERVEGIGVSPTMSVGLTAEAMARGEDTQLNAALRALETGLAPVPVR